jgi:CRISPR-associated protein Cas1
MRFTEALPENITLQQLRGREGARVRDAYASAARTFGVSWGGRNYDRTNWERADPLNRSLSAGASCLYGLCHGAIIALGFSPGIGFIHTGKQLSFVYDVADLYKVEFLIPAAFEAVATAHDRVETSARRLFREHAQRGRLLERIAAALPKLLDGIEAEQVLESAVDVGDMPGALWNRDGIVGGGVNYGRDDT